MTTHAPTLFTLHLHVDEPQQLESDSIPFVRAPQARQVRARLVAGTLAPSRRSEPVVNLPADVIACIGCTAREHTLAQHLEATLDAVQAKLDSLKEDVDDMVLKFPTFDDEPTNPGPFAA